MHTSSVYTISISNTLKDLYRPVRVVNMMAGYGSVRTIHQTIAVQEIFLRPKKLKRRTRNPNLSKNVHQAAMAPSLFSMG
jgi:hypothetical protein